MGRLIDVFWHEDVLRHDGGAGVFGGEPSDLLTVDEVHVEGADRIRNIHSALKRGPLKDSLRWHDGRHASRDELLAFHHEAYIDRLLRAESEGGRRYTWETVVATGSTDSILASAGTALSAMRHMLDGKGDLVYALVRPPGHHSSPDQADGYCFVNQVGLCAELARGHGKARVATLDWDVHHGNGTQQGFYHRADVLTVSLHMDHGGPWGPQHPQTGKADEVGRGPGAGYNINIPLPMGSGDADYERAMIDMVIPAMDEFKPEALIIACGQDASAYDPNGRQLVSMDGFHRLGVLAREIADRHTGGQICLIQEGGYQVSYTALCLHATLEGVLGKQRLVEDPLYYYRADPNHAAEAIVGIMAERKKAMATA